MSEMEMCLGRVFNFKEGRRSGLFLLLLKGVRVEFELRGLDLG